MAESRTKCRKNYCFKNGITYRSGSDYIAKHKQNKYCIPNELIDLNISSICTIVDDEDFSIIPAVSEVDIRTTPVVRIDKGIKINFLFLQIDSNPIVKKDDVISNNVDNTAVSDENIDSGFMNYIV